MQEHSSDRTRLTALLVFVLLVLAYLAVREVGLGEIERVVGENRLLGAALFSLVMFGATVIAPIAALPMVPVLAPLLGPFTTGLAAFVGWTMGAIVAFWIGRWYGKPVVLRFVSLSAVERYERYIKPETGFLLIVFLRMLLPVDVLSYALGIFSSVSFPLYVTATMLGIVWFSFAFSYLGSALSGGDYVLLAVIGVASVLILVGSWWYIHRSLRKEERSNL